MSGRHKSALSDPTACCRRNLLQAQGVSVSVGIALLSTANPKEYGVILQDTTGSKHGEYTPFTQHRECNLVFILVDDPEHPGVKKTVFYEHWVRAAEEDSNRAAWYEKDNNFIHSLMKELVGIFFIGIVVSDMGSCVSDIFATKLTPTTTSLAWADDTVHRLCPEEAGRISTDLLGDRCFHFNVASDIIIRDFIDRQVLGALGPGVFMLGTDSYHCYTKDILKQVGESGEVPLWQFRDPDEYS